MKLTFPAASISSMLQAAALGAAELVGDPDVAEAVDREAAAGEAGLEGFDLGWIGGGKAGDMIAEDVA